MKKLKKLLSLLIVSALLFANTPSLSSFASTTEISVGGNYELSFDNGDETKELTFTPTETAVYIFSSTANGERTDPSITIFDKNDNEVLYADDSGVLDFISGAKFIAGETYTVIARCVNAAGGNWTLSVSENIIESVSINDLQIIEGSGTEQTSCWDPELGTDVFFDVYRYRVEGTVVVNGFGELPIDNNCVVFDGKSVEIAINDDQGPENHWGIGNHNAEADFLGTTASFNVEIIESPVSDLYLSPVTIYENTFCEKNYYWDSETNEEKFWIRYNYSINGTISLGNGEFIDIVDSFFDWNNVHESVRYFDTQSLDSPWTVGNPYEITVEVLGKTGTMEITIAESPFESVNITDVTVGPQDKSVESTYDPETDKFVFWDRYSYNVNGWITLKEGGTVPLENSSFTFNGNTYSFSIENFGQDYKSPWEEGNAYVVTTEWLGLPVSYNVTVAENPISSVVFNDAVVYEGIDCWTSYEWDDEVGDYVEYKEFFIPVSGYMTFNNGREDFYFDWDNFEFDGSYVSVSVTNEQGILNQWEVGKDYEVTATLMGVTSTFTVSVKANPIKKIKVQNAIVDANAYSIYTDYNEETDEYGFEYRAYEYPVNGTIYLNDGTEIPIEQSWFVWEDTPECVSVEDTQGYKSEWNPGGSYVVYVYVFGVKTEFYVTVMPSPIKSLTLNDINLYENLGGWITGEWDDETQSMVEYFYYSYDLSGTVTLSNGAEIDFVNGSFTYGGKNYSVYLYEGAQSAYSPWVLGENEIKAFIDGVGILADATVTINPSPIERVEAHDLTLYKGVHDSDGYYFFTPSYTVYLNDGTELASDDYGYVYLDNYTEIPIDILDPQSDETPWDIGEHQVIIKVGGKEASFKVTIEESPYTDIKISGTNSLSVTLYKENDENEVWSVESVEINGFEDYSSFIATLYCDKGVLPNASLYYEDDSFVNGLYIKLGDMKSNTLAKNAFVRFSILNYNYAWAISSANFYSHLGLLPEFTTDIENMDIDLLCFLAAALDLNGAEDEIYDDKNNVYYQIYSVESIKKSLLYNFGIEDIDLSGASGYEEFGEGTICILSSYESDLGDGDFTGETTENGWKTDFKSIEKSRIDAVSVTLNDQAIITGFDISLNVFGDVSGDNVVNTEDANLILRLIEGENVDVPLSLADINGDYVVDIADVVLILQHVAGYDVGI